MAQGDRPTPRRGTPGWRLVVVALILATGAAPAAGEPVEPDPGPATVTLDALPLSIPLAALDPAARTRAETVLGGSAFAHRITALRARSREAVFHFLLDHPDFAAGVARALRLGGYRVSAAGDGYDADDTRGAQGTIRLLHAGAGQRLYHVAGRYQTRGLPPIEGQMLVDLEFHHAPVGEADSVLQLSLTGHLRIDTPVVGTLAQAVALLARPVVERAVERKVRRFFDTVARVSRWAHDEPEELLAALDGHPELQASAEQLETFRRILLAGRRPAWARLPLRLLPDEPGPR